MGRVKEDRNLIAFIILALAVAMIVLSFLSFVAISNGQYNCQQNNMFKETLAAQVRASQERLPQVQYYKEHPNELKIQEKFDTQLLAALHPTTCKGIFGNSSPLPKTYVPSSPSSTTTTSK